MTCDYHVTFLAVESPYITSYPTPIVGLTEGNRVLFSCAAISHLPISALWLKDEENITNSSALTVSSDTGLGSEYSAYESTLTLDPTRETDSGLYTCLMQNSEGTAQFSFQQDVERTSTQTEDGVCYCMLPQVYVYFKLICMWC